MMMNSSKFMLVKVVLLLGLNLLLTRGESQTEHKLLHHHFRDEIVFTQPMPDGTTRLFAFMDQSNWGNDDFLYFTRIHPDQDLSQMHFNTVAVDSSFVNWNVYRTFFIPLASGATIVATTQFDCDYFLPGGLCRIEPNDSLSSMLDFPQLKYYIYAERMVFIDENAIFLVGEKSSQSIIVDTNGLEIDYPFPQDYYDITVQTKTGFLGGVNSKFDILNSTFDVVTSYTLNGNIEFIEHQGNDRYLIRAGLRYYEWKEGGDVETLPTFFDLANRVWLGQNSYWAVFTSSLGQFDSNFNPIDTSLIPHGVTIESLNDIDSLQLLMTEYAHPISTGILFYRSEGDLDLRLPLDIGITGIIIPDTVHVDPNGPPTWAYTYTYDSVEVEVTNFGTDTVHYYEIQAFQLQNCFWCNSQLAVWEINNPLAPGETTTLSLGEFIPYCAFEKDLPLCLTTVGPDFSPDGDNTNDKFCVDIANIILATKEPIPSIPIEVFPNPADDNLSIRFPEFTSLPVSLVLSDLRGIEIQSFNAFEYDFQLATNNLSPGIYFLSMENQQGNSVQKISIQH